MKAKRPGFLQRLAWATQQFTGTVLDLPDGWFEGWIRGEEGGLLGGRRELTNPAAEHAYAHGAVASIAQTLIQAPWRIARDTDAEQLVETGPAHDLFHPPNPLDSLSDLWEKTTIGLLQNTKGVMWIYHFLQEGPVLPTSVPISITLHNAAEFEPALTAGQFAGWRHVQTGKPIPKEKAVWFRYPDPDNPFMSLTPFRALRRALADDVDAADYSGELFRHGGRLGLVLTTDDPSVDSELAKEYQRKLDDSHAGPGRRFKSLVMGGGSWSVEDHSQTQRDMEFTGQRGFNREEVRAATRLGPLMFGDVTDGNRANVLGQERVVWRQVLIPMMGRYESGLEGGLFNRFRTFAGLKGFFDRSGVEALQRDLQSQVTTGEGLQRLGYTSNELNEYFEWGLPEAPHRDTVFMQASLVPVEDLLAGGLGDEEDDDPPPPPPDDDDDGDDDPGGDEGGEGDDEDGPPDDNSDQTGSRRTPPPNPPPTVRLRAERVDLWRSIYADYAKLERLMRGRVARHFMALRAIVLENIRGLFRQGAAPGKAFLDDSTVEALILWDQEAGVDALRKAAMPLYKKGLKKGGEAVVVEVGAGAAFDLFDESVVNYLDGRIPPLVGIDNTTRKAVTQVVKSKMLAGESQAGVVKAVRARFGMEARRAQNIARTEVAGAYNNGRAQAMEQTQTPYMGWLTAGDEDVRDSHLDNDGLEVPLGEAFPNGLRWPHDPNGDPEEVINCRCVPLPIRRPRS
jgi:SPP1 gp7 family putative phage head morphogenesis protein